MHLWRARLDTVLFAAAAAVVAFIGVLLVAYGVEHLAADLGRPHPVHSGYVRRL